MLRYPSGPRGPLVPSRRTGGSFLEPFPSLLLPPLQPGCLCEVRPSLSQTAPPWAALTVLSEGGEDGQLGLACALVWREELSPAIDQK